MALKDLLPELLKLGATGNQSFSSSIQEEPKVAIGSGRVSELPEVNAGAVVSVCTRAVDALDRAMAAQQELKEALLEMAQLWSPSPEVEEEIPVDVEEPVSDSELVTH